MSKPILWIVIPCYNEEKVLPITAPMFLQKLQSLAEKGLVSDKSRVLFVNDGSRDSTWELICRFAKEDEHFIGISQSRNRGHQNAVLAGLMEAKASDCDITISIDCDGQDDINAMDEMVQKYLDGAEVVYGVRSRRDTDTFFKRFTAEGFYHVMHQQVVDHHPRIAETVDQFVGEHHAVHTPERVVRGEKIASLGVESFEPFDRIGDLPFAETGADELLRRQRPVVFEDIVDFRLVDRAAKPVHDRTRYPACQPRSFLLEYGADVDFRHGMFTKLYPQI